MAGSRKPRPVPVWLIYSERGTPEPWCGMYFSEFDAQQQANKTQRVVKYIPAPPKKRSKRNAKK
jgi:hypothetical protein